MKKSVLLIGDTIIDKYHYLSPTGFSLETPTIKCERVSTKIEFGGAANVAREMTLLGCSVDFLTSVENDLVKELEDSTSAKVHQVGINNQIKERFYLIKNETYKYLQINDAPGIKKRLSCKLNFDLYDMIVISDYRLGVLNLDLLSSLPKNKTICQMQISDSDQTLDKFSGFHAVVGNTSEIPHHNICNLAERLNSMLISTNGEKEVICYNMTETYKVFPKAVENVKDYHGAGDSFYAGFCATYDFSQSSIEDAMKKGCDTAYKYLLREQNAI